MSSPPHAPPSTATRPESARPDAMRTVGDRRFYLALGLLGGFYVLIIIAMLAADFAFAFGKFGEVVASLMTPEIRFATWLSLTSASISAILSLWVAVPLGYLLARHTFRGKLLVDAILDIPIFLPPLVVGLSLLILFRQTPLRALDDWIGISMYIPAVVLSQFVVAAAFAARTLRATFEDLSPRCEQVALTLGCTRSQAFWSVVLPDAWGGVLTAGTMAWARALGEFGPIMIFAGSTRMKTEVLPVSVYLEFSIGNIEGAVGVSLLMVIVALAVLVTVRKAGGARVGRRGG